MAGATRKKPEHPSFVVDSFITVVPTVLPGSIDTDVTSPSLLLQLDVGLVDTFSSSLILITPKHAIQLFRSLK